MQKGIAAGIVSLTVVLVVASCRSETAAGAPGQPAESVPHAEGTGAATEDPGSISISPEARANIGLTTEVAEERVLERALPLNATLQVHPDLEAFVSSRVQGKVTAVHGNVGEPVRPGQVLVVLQSLQIAETPPLVEVTSPLEGVILERTVTVGETVDPTKSLFHVANIAHLWAAAEVYEADLASVRVGQPARLRVTAYPSREFTGRVIRLSDEIDPQNRTLRIFVEVTNTPDRILKGGMFGVVSVVTGGTGRAVTVPNQAVQSDGPERFVFLKNGEQFQRQNVVVGDRNDRYTAIRSGVIAGDEVVVRGAAQLAMVARQPGAGGAIDESKPHTH